jgi:predicted ATPase
LMSQAILATTDRPLVIIDEPELSLGIEWQRNLIPELLACTATAGVQFLVASHSLQVMNAVVRTDIIHPTEGS